MNFSKLPNSYDKFHEVAKNIEQYFLKEFSYLLFGQILFDFFLDGHHFGHITKLLKGKTLMQGDMYNTKVISQN